MTPSDPAKQLTPLLAAGALIALSAAWFTPLPEPRSSEPTVRIGPTGTDQTTDTVQVRAIGSTPDHDWLALSGPLSRLREPLVTIETETVQVEQEEIVEPIAIRYLGLVSTSNSNAAALIEIDGRQRFISIGDTIVDESRGNLVVQEITEEKIVFERSGIETTIMRQSRQNQRPGSRSPRPLGPDRDEDPRLGGSGIR